MHLRVGAQPAHIAGPRGQRVETQPCPRIGGEGRPTDRGRHQQPAAGQCHKPVKPVKPVKLVNDGLLLRVPGKGTYVAPSKINAVSPAYRGIREQLEALGYSTTTRLVSFEREAASSVVRERLGLARGDEVYVIARVRSVQGEPISLHRSHVPATLAPGLDEHDVVSEQLCVILEKDYGLPMRHVSEHLEAVAVSLAEARQLDMHRGDPALLLHDVIADEGGRPFEYSTIVFRGDRLRLAFDYSL